MNNFDDLSAYLPGEDTSEGLGSVPAGNYPCVVEDVEPKQTAKGGFMWRLTLKSQQGNKFWYNMNWLDEQGNLSGGIGFTQMALKALGLPHVSNNGQPMQANYKKSDVVGKYVLAVVSVQASGEYAGRNQVDRLEPYGQTRPTGGAVSTAAPAAAPWGGGASTAPAGGAFPPPASGGFSIPGGGRPPGIDFANIRDEDEEPLCFLSVSEPSAI